MKKQTMPILTFAALLLFSFENAIAENETSPPWRRSDATLIQVCFDKLRGDPPQTLRAREISDISTGSANLELIGMTLAHKPIYQGAFGHPTRFRSLLLELPDGGPMVKIDAPSELQKYIEVWKDIAAERCTTDRRTDIKTLRGEPIGEVVECPDVGLNVSLQVAASAHHSLAVIHARNKGPSTVNGLRGCRDFVYGSGK